MLYNINYYKFTKNNKYKNKLIILNIYFLMKYFIITHDTNSYDYK